MTHHAPIPPYVQCRCPHCAFGPLRMLARGAIWPHGRDAARDDAQIRQSRRDVTNAATVAA